MGGHVVSSECLCGGQLSQQRLPHMYAMCVCTVCTNVFLTRYAGTLQEHNHNFM